MTAPTQHFGKRVLGKDEYERQANAVKASQNRGIGLGSRVTGESPSPRARKAAALAAAAVEARHGDTERDTPPVEEPVVAEVVEAAAEENSPPAPEAGAPVPTSEVGQMSIAQMTAALKENASLDLFDTLLDQELNHRPEGQPRKGALQVLLAAEQARAEPREAIVNELKQAIAGN
jgi:hypothetical protein